MSKMSPYLYMDFLTTYVQRLFFVNIPGTEFIVTVLFVATMKLLPKRVSNSGLLKLTGTGFALQKVSLKPH
jgi:hypothetical protein